MSPKNDSGSSWLDPMGSRTIDLDALLTPEQFAQWVGESELWVRRRLASLPGVIREGRSTSEDFTHQLDSAAGLQPAGPDPIEGLRMRTGKH